MIRRSLGMLALATVTSLLAACSSGASGSDEPAGSDSTEGALANGASSLTVRYNGTDLGILLIRLEVKGDKITGHATPQPADEYNNFARGEVSGTLENGEYKFGWQIPNFSAKPTFVGKLVNGKLDGTITVQGGPSFAASMTEIKPGTLENGRPISYRFYNQETVGSCTAEYGGFELFGLKNTALEQSIAAKVDAAAKKAVDACKGNVVSTMGGMSRGVIRADIVSFTSGVFTDSGDAGWKYSFGERGTYEIATGRELSLFGDVIQPGKEAELAAAIEHAIDTLDSGSIDANEKQKMKDAMLSAAGKAKLPKVFALNDRGVSFASEDYNTPKVQGITVKYSDLTAILAPNGKAKSAWTP